jgi:hypothetical protein
MPVKLHLFVPCQRGDDDAREILRRPYFFERDCFRSHVSFTPLAHRLVMILSASSPPPRSSDTSVCNKTLRKDGRPLALVLVAMPLTLRKLFAFGIELQPIALHDVHCLSTDAVVIID